MPYFRALCGAVLDQDVNEIVVCKSAQIAGTTVMVVVLCYYIHQFCCNAMLCLADEDTAKYINKEVIQSMFKNSNTLSRLEKNFTTGELWFTNNSYLCVAWASSVAKIASKPMMIVIGDEVDKPGYYPSTTSKETTPIKNIQQRIEAKTNAKSLFLSTPTTDASNIYKRLDACDIVIDHHVPCPYCGQLQPLVWGVKWAPDFQDGLYRAEDGTMHKLGGVVWEGGREATTEQIDAGGYQCGECGQIWTTTEKNRAVEQGIPVPRTDPPARVHRVGFHVNRLYSLLARSGDIGKLIQEWIDAIKSKDPAEIQSFYNNVLAIRYVDRIQQVEENQLTKLRCSTPPLIVPQSAIALTCGIDVGKFDFYASVWAWSRDPRQAWLIRYEHFHDWAQVEQLLFEDAYRIDETSEYMGVWRAAIDTGGGESESDDWTRTEEVYDWLRRMGRRTAWGIKGMSRGIQSGVNIKSSRIEKFPNGKIIPNGLMLWHINTGYFKDLLFSWINSSMEAVDKNDEDPIIHFHEDTQDDFFKQLLGEEKRRTKNGGYEWVRIRDNHYLDTTVYAFACAHTQWAGGIDVLRGAVKGAPQVQRIPGPPPRTTQPSKSTLPKISGKDWFKR